jgi:hypothetical protein
VVKVHADLADLAVLSDLKVTLVAHPVPAVLKVLWACLV